MKKAFALLAAFLMVIISVTGCSTKPTAANAISGNYRLVGTTDYFGFPAQGLSDTQWKRLVEIQQYLSKSQYTEFSDTAPVLRGFMEGQLTLEPAFHEVPAIVATEQTVGVPGNDGRWIMNQAPDDLHVTKTGLFISQKYLSSEIQLPVEALNVAKELQQVLLTNHYCSDYMQDLSSFLQTPLDNCTQVFKITAGPKFSGYFIDGASYGLMMHPYVGLNLKQYIQYPIEGQYLSASKQDTSAYDDGKLTTNIIDWATGDHVSCLSQWTTQLANHKEEWIQPETCVNELQTHP
jgi:hypothetical protein